MARHFNNQSPEYRNHPVTEDERVYAGFDYAPTRAEYERYAGSRPYRSKRSGWADGTPRKRKRLAPKTIAKSLVLSVFVAFFLFVASIAISLARYSPLVPHLGDMLGMDGSSRNYLLIAQNNAELRATGGFAGSWTLITVTNGKLEKGESLTLQHSSTVDYNWTDEELSNFPMVTRADPSGVNFTPDFQRAGSRFALAYETNTGTSVDGVIAIDPVFLQRILALTGGVTASDGTTVDGDNAARALENDVYWRYGNDGVAQDEFFSEVASLAFDQFSSDFSLLDVLPAVGVVNRSADDHHLQVWMASTDEEKAIKDAGIGGEVSLDQDDPTLGVYMNDNTWSKIDWYLRIETQIGASSRNQDGSTTYQVQTTWSNIGSTETYNTAPAYISGVNPEKTEVSDMLLYPLLVAPAGGDIIDVEFSDGGKAERHTLYGLNTWTRRLDLTAEQSVTATYTVTVSSEAGSRLVVRSTPLGTDDE